MNPDHASPSIYSRSPLIRFGRWLLSWAGLKRMLIVAAWTATIVALIYAEENWRGKRTWNSYVLKTASTGEVLTFDSLTPKPVPDDQNFYAAPVMERLRLRQTNGDRAEQDEFDKAASMLRDPKPRDNTRRFIDLHAWQQAFEAAQAGEQHADIVVTTNAAPPDARARAAQAVLKSMETQAPFLADLSAAAQRPCARSPVNYKTQPPPAILLQHLGGLKSLEQRLQLRASAELAVGQPEPALADTLLMLYIADSVKEEPILVSCLVRIACFQIAARPVWEGLAEHRWTDPQLEALQKRFQEYRFITDAHRALMGERACILATVDYVKKERRISMFGDNASPCVDFATWLAPGGWFLLEKYNLARLVDAWLKPAVEPASNHVNPQLAKERATEVKGEMERYHGLRALLSHRLIAQMLLPNLDRVLVRAASAQTVADQAAIACALERYRLANGRLPARLEDLAPRFISSLPQDAATGKTYQYRPDEGGQYVLYSLGWDGDDDGGKPGKQMFDDQNGDWVWSLN